MHVKNYNKHIPSFKIFHWITLVFNGFNLGNPLPTSTNVCELGDSEVCQEWWIKWMVDACTLINVPHGELGSNVEAWMGSIFYGPNISNSPFGGSFWSWMLPFNSSHPCERIGNPINITDLLDFLAYCLTNFISNEALRLVHVCYTRL